LTGPIETLEPGRRTMVTGRPASDRRRAALSVVMFTRSRSARPERTPEAFGRMSIGIQWEKNAWVGCKRSSFGPGIR
jgi:hypothetical protein